MAQYYVGGVRGLKDYLDVLRIVYEKSEDPSKFKYYSKQHAVGFMANSKIDVSSLVEELAEKGLVLKIAGVLE
jgi:hypothetical protein